MFSTKEQLIKKTGKHGVGRFSFLEQLINEYKVTKSSESRKQVLANLANFAYDPVNYEYLWRLKVLDVFFEALEDKDSAIVSYAISGICNICLEPLSREYILRTNGVQIISPFLANAEESIVLSAITTLIFLDTPNSRKDVISAKNIEQIKILSKSSNSRIKNLAEIFLQDLCNIHQSQKFTVHSNKSVKKLSYSKTPVTSTVTSATDTATASTSSAPFY